MLHDGRYASLIMLTKLEANQLVKRSWPSKWAVWLVFVVAIAAVYVVLR